LSGRFPQVDPRTARRRFARAAGTYAAASRLEAEVASRMLERLDYLKLAPRRILDAGSGPARDAPKLIAKYRGSEFIALDFALPSLQAAKTRFFEKKRLRVCADLGRQPIAGGAIDFVWSNMALHCAGDVREAIREFHRVLSPEGLVMFSTLGPDTLKELRAAAGAARVHEFTDMHDLGDMLVEAGFAAPVMEMEALTMEYAEPGALLADLRAGGQTNARADRARGLSGKGWHRRLLESLPARATYEVVYGHAWKGAPRKAADGRDIVQFRSRGGGFS
jgi:malonyl-CoA O-methyltransferase